MFNIFKMLRDKLKRDLDIVANRQQNQTTHGSIMNTNPNLQPRLGRNAQARSNDQIDVPRMKWQDCTGNSGDLHRDAGGIYLYRNFDGITKGTQYSGRKEYLSSQYQTATVVIAPVKPNQGGLMGKIKKWFSKKTVAPTPPPAQKKYWN